jgi:superfamily II DNA or RNA helicase
MFFNDSSIRGSWQAFERLVCRYLEYDGFKGVRLVGQRGDKGADVIAHKAGKRWLVQVKHWRTAVGPETVDETLAAMRIYRADVPVIAALSSFQQAVHQHQQELMAQTIPLQLWSGSDMVAKASTFNDDYPRGNPSDIFEERKYQEDAIQLLVHTHSKADANRALVVMATGLGKTRVACEFIRRASQARPLKVLTLAHTNPLVLQLEKSFWPYLKASQETLVWNGHEHQSFEDLERSNFIFACIDTAADHVEKGRELPDFDIVFIDECHHVGDEGMYANLISEIAAGQPGGPFLVGVTATPWRPDESELRDTFGDALVSVDLVTGLKKGFLSKVDYRMYTDNIDWNGLRQLRGNQFSPKKINRTLFIPNWDDAVVLELQKAWQEQENPRAIVFCGTIDHTITMRDRINALGFCKAEAIYSQGRGGAPMEPSERNRILCDFHDGEVQVVCAMNIFNEGIDVPDVNIVVFQRVTHSRRIFIQQLGRGLRLSEGKEKVIVLDFVSDIRRFAAGICLKDELAGGDAPPPGQSVTVRLPNKVEFRRAGEEDPQTESFLREWLEDVATVESEEDEDAPLLKFPPKPPGGR